MQMHQTQVAIDDAPTPKLSDIWEERHDAAAKLAEKLYAWAESRRNLDPIARRSLGAAERAHQEAKEAERLGAEAFAIAWSLAEWPRSQPTLEECARAMVLLDDAIAIGEKLMAGIR